MRDTLLKAIRKEQNIAILGMLYLSLEKVSFASYRYQFQFFHFAGSPHIRYMHIYWTQFYDQTKKEGEELLAIEFERQLFPEENNSIHLCTERLFQMNVV